MEQVQIPAQFTFKQGERDMGDKGKKDKGKREQQKKAQLSPKEKRKLKKEKQSFASNRHVEENHNRIA